MLYIFGVSQGKLYTKLKAASLLPAARRERFSNPGRLTQLMTRLMREWIWAGLGIFRWNVK